jgi:hypothetical protein
MYQSPSMNLTIDWHHELLLKISKMVDQMKVLIILSQMNNLLEIVERENHELIELPEERKEPMQQQRGLIDE